MRKRLNIQVISLLILINSVCIILFCSEPSNPFSNPANVTIDLVLPDTTNKVVYTIDTNVIKIVVTLTSLVDSVKLTVGSYYESLFTEITDTMEVKHVFNDTGDISVSAIAYCKMEVTKDCQKSLRVYKNPLVPPAVINTQALSDTTITLFWESVSVAVTYNIYRSLSDTGTFSLVQSVVDTFYTDSALSPATTYYYKASSIDSLNRESVLSSAYSGTTMDVSVSKWDSMVWDRDEWE